jgi:hypothetical protein
MLNIDASTLKQFIVPLTAIFVATLTYWLAKRREREAEWRTAKLEFYKVFIEATSGIMAEEGSPETQRAYSKASNNLLLFAPQEIIELNYNFRKRAKTGSGISIDEHNELLTEFILAVRKDIGVKPKDDVKTFKAELWNSGHPR